MKMFKNPNEFIKNTLSMMPKDFASFNIQKVDFLNFQKETRSQFLWCKLLEYVQNRQKKGMFSKYIAIQRVRKEIYELYGSLGETKRFIFESHNIFKSILIQKIFIPFWKNNKDVREKIDYAPIYAELINDKDLFLGKFELNYS